MNRQDVYGLIRGLVGQANIIAIPRLFIKLAGGDYEAAAFLTQCVYWSDYARADGWFYKPYSDWNDELELSEYHIRRVTSIWRDRGVLQTNLRMVARRPLVHYRVDMDALADQLVKMAGGDSEKIAESDSEKFSESTIKSFQNPYTVDYLAKEGSDTVLRTVSGVAATPPAKPSQTVDIRDWPEGLTPRHVRALVGAGYTPETAKDADPQALRDVPGVGVKAVMILTGVDLTAESQVPIAIKAIQNVCERAPSKMLWRRLEALVGDAPDEAMMGAAFETWCARGYNPLNYDGWLSWYTDGIPQPKRPTSLPPRRKDIRNGTSEPDDTDYAALLEEARQRAICNGIDLAAIAPALLDV